MLEESARDVGGEFGGAAARLPGQCLTKDNALHAHHRVHQTSWRIRIALLLTERHVLSSYL
jgi:hypothetical protein